MRARRVHVLVEETRNQTLHRFAPLQPGQVVLLRSKRVHHSSEDHFLPYDPVDQVLGDRVRNQSSRCNRAEPRFTHQQKKAEVAPDLPSDESQQPVRPLLVALTALALFPFAFTGMQSPGEHEVEPSTPQQFPQRNKKPERNENLQRLARRKSQVLLGQVVGKNGKQWSIHHVCWRTSKLFAPMLSARVLSSREAAIT